MHACVVRALDKWDVLTEFFRLCTFEDQKDKEAFAILKSLQNPFIKGYLLFLKYTLNYFNKLNGLFQSSKIIIHKLHECSVDLMKQLCQNFMRANIMPSIETIDVTHPHFQVFFVLLFLEMKHAESHD